MKSFTGIFCLHLKLPHAPLMFWLKTASIKFWGAPPQCGWGQHSSPPCSQHLWKTLNFVLTLEAGGRKMSQNFLQSTWKAEYEKSNNIWIIYIFLRDITCLNRIQVILRLYEKDKLVQREFFQKAKPLWGGTYKNRIHQPGQLEQSQFSLKYLKLIW